MRIYLIGMPGCGKSTLGTTLAEKINYKFLDMDTYIETKANKSIPEIFDIYGEDYFRSLEVDALKDFKSMDNIIIATGGGVIKNKNNKSLMDGKCIYLNVDLDELQYRCDHSTSIRPLLKVKTIKELYNERKDLYDYFKDIEVDNSNLESAINSILKEIE